MLRVLRQLFHERGIPAFIRCDNGAEFIAHEVERVLGKCGVEVAFIAPGSPWQNGKNERLNEILPHELLNRELLSNLLEAQVLCEQWRETYNEVRPHGSRALSTPAAYASQARVAGSLVRTATRARGGARATEFRGGSSP